MLQTQKDAIAEQLASAKRNFEVDIANIADTNEAQASADLMIDQEITAINNPDVARKARQQTIEEALLPLATLYAGVKRSAPESAAIEAYVSSAEQQNFGVLGQEITLDIVKRDITKSHSHQDVSGSDIPSYSVSQTTNSIGVQWDILIDIFRRHRQQQRTPGSGTVEHSPFRSGKCAPERDSQHQASLSRRVSKGPAQVKVYEAVEISSQSSLDSDRLDYQVGTRINIDVLNAQQ